MNRLNKRRRAANRTAKRHGTKVSKKKTSLLKYCLFITNIPSTIFSSIQVTATYRARWRVELIFKQRKSCLKLHFFKGYNIERFYCFLYGRLIMILLLGSMFPPLMLYAFKLYTNNLKNWNFGFEKATGLNDHKCPHISNIRAFMIV
jgi:IS4 transposase